MPTSAAFSALAQQSAASLRNIANESELLAWLEDLAVEKVGPASARVEREQKLAGWLSTVGRRFMLKSGATRPFERDEGEELPEWMNKALASGAQLMSLSLETNERDDFAALLDWMRSEQGPAANADWSKVSIAQAQSASESWHKEQRDQAEKILAQTEGLAGSKALSGLSDLGHLGEEWKGWKWVGLESKAALMREGAQMRHCVGSYASIVASGSTQIYSLRDPENKPRITVEARGKRFVQAKAFSNARPTKEFGPLVEALLFHVDNQPQLKGVLTLSPDFEKLGLNTLDPIGLSRRGPTGWELTPAQDEALTEWMKGKNDKVRAWRKTLLDACSMGFSQVIERLAPTRRDPFFLGLERAAENGHADVCQRLLPLTDPSNDRHCALRLAAENGHLGVCELLAPYADLKSDPEPLLNAAIGGHLEVFKLLATFSAPLDQVPELAKAAGAGGSLEIVRLTMRDPDDAGVMLMEGAGTHKLTMALATELIDKGASEWAAGVALVKASAWANKPLLETLSAKADSTAILSKALLEAVQAENKEAFNFLLPLSDPGVGDSEALRTAVGVGNHKMVKSLLSRSDPKAKASEALKIAIKKQEKEIFNLLLPLSDPKAGEKQAIEVAIEQGVLGLQEWEGDKTWEFVGPLISRSSKLAKNSTALASLAAAGERALMIKLLPLCDPIDHGGPALVAAARRGRVEEGRIALDFLSKMEPNRVIEASVVRNEALNAAVEGGSVELMDALEAWRVPMPTSALARALEHANWKVAESVLSKLAGILSKEELREPLLKAVEFAPLSLVEALASLTDPAFDNSAPFRAAVRADRLDVVQALLPVSDARAMDSEALRVAVGKNNKDMVDALLPYSDAAAKQSECLRTAAGIAGQFDRVEKARLGAERFRPNGIALLNNPEYVESVKSGSKGALELVRRLIPLSNPKDCDSEALRYAASHQSVELVRLLEPVSDPMARDCEALRFAAKALPDSATQLIELLLPRSDANANKCEALKSALKAGELEPLQLLIPATDPEEAERLIKKEEFEEEAEAMLLALVNPAAPKMKRSAGRETSSPFRSSPRRF